MSDTFTQHGHDRHGLIAAAMGLTIAAGALLLATSCCWLPILLLPVGLATILAAALGATWYIVAGGVGLFAGGLAWHFHRRRQAAGPCCEGGPDGSGS